MKKHNVVRIGYVVVTVFVGTLLVFACKNPTGVDVDNENSVTVGGQTYALSELYFEEFPGFSTGTGYNIDLSINGQSAEVDLEMFFSGSSVSAGMYSFSDNHNSNTFSSSSYVATVNNIYSISGGDVEISISGSTYTINGRVTVSGGSQATFNYSGPVTGHY